MRYIGTSVPIHDAMGKACGKTLYAADMTLPGMLHLALLTSRVPHGTVQSVCAKRALELPGVVDVLHCFNTTKRLFNRYRNIYGQELIDQEQVFPARLRFAGDRVACVIAETAKAAREALPLIDVEIEELPYATDAKTVLESGVLDSLHPDGAVYPIREMINGEPPDTAGAVFTTTDCRIERVSHVTMEPQACVASYSRDTGELTVWSPNQSVHGLRTVLAELFELPYNKLRVVKTTMGGSFGSKQEWMAEPVAAAAALHTGRPVKIAFTREQAMLSSITRCAVDSTLTTAATKDGKILSIELDATVDAGGYLSNSRDYCVVLSSKLFRFYSFPYAKYTGRAVCTNSPVSGAFRGWGSPELFLILEHNFNTLARKLDIDPTELRLLNVAAPGSHDKRTGQPLGEIRGGECIRLGREKFDWYAKRDACKTFNAQNGRYRRGVAVGCGGHGNGYFPRREDFSSMEMRMAEDGSVIANMTLHDHGCGSVTAMKMIIAESLEIPIEKITLGEGDTAATPFDVGCFASRTTYVLGCMALGCALKLKAHLVECAAEVLGVQPDLLKAKNGGIVLAAGGETLLSFADVAVKAIRKLQREVCVTHRHINASNPGVTGAHFAHVEVDTQTGMVRVLDYLAVHDIGRVINREITIAQVQGAVAMGTGAALTESMRPDKNGRFTASLKDYHLRNCPELPHVAVEFIEAGSIQGPYGAKSIGELANVPVAPAIVGAVNDALGSSLNEVPLNPEKIVRTWAHYLAAR
ncbi:MAG: molybdopterin-dependent oxidoreductase [Spirochaetes bacterium]|nr:molybdopterin-dependent oxidoreductase [Spirochaetota bacterium]